MPVKDVPVHAERLAQIMDFGGIPVREDVLFTNHKGAEKSSLRKRATKALEKLRDILKNSLEPDEVVLYLTLAQAPIGGLQQWTLGWMTYQITKTMLVVTNRRILALRLHPKSFGGWEWGRGIRSIRFGDLTEAKAKGFLTWYLQLRYADGRKERYWGLQGADGKKLRLILEAVLPASAGEASAARGAVSLCPACAAVLAEKQESCQQCRQLFATEREMWIRSILLPGGGYFYVGQRALGLLDAFVESMLTGLVVLWALVLAGAPEPLLGDLEPYATPGQVLFFFGFFAVILIFEKLVTGLHGRHFVKDFYPLDNPPNQAKWLAWGLASYLAIGLVVWSVIPWNEKPLVQVASDVQVYRADFGLFTKTVNGDIFTPSSTVPFQQGARYGIVLRFRTPRPSVKFRFAFEFADPNVKPGEGAAPPEETLENEGGLIARFWEVAPDEPEGQQILKIYLEGELVKSFVFAVKGPRMAVPSRGR